MVSLGVDLLPDWDEKSALNFFYRTIFFPICLETSEGGEKPGSHTLEKRLMHRIPYPFDKSHNTTPVYGEKNRMRTGLRGKTTCCGHCARNEFIVWNLFLFLVGLGALPFHQGEAGHDLAQGWWTLALVHEHMAR